MCTCVTCTYDSVHAKRVLLYWEILGKFENCRDMRFCISMYFSGDKVMDTDEHPRPEVTTAQMAKLPPVFMKGGTVNAANASVSLLNIVLHVLGSRGEGGLK